MDDKQPNNINQSIETTPAQASNSALSEPAKSEKTSKPLLIILTILLIISLAAGGVFAYLYFSNNTQTPTASNPAPEIIESTESEDESTGSTLSIAQVETLLKDKYKFDTSTMVIFDGWHKYIENLDQPNKILFTIYRVWNENKFRSEQSTDSCDPIIYNIGFDAFNDLYVYYFGDTEPLERKDYQFDSLVTKAVYNSENDGFDVYFPNCLGGYSTVRMLSKIDNVIGTENGFTATILTTTLDFVVRQDANEGEPSKSGGDDEWYYDIPMSDETLEEIRNSLSAYEFNFVDDNGEYKLISIEKI